MPRRTATRAHNRAKAIDAERAHNQAARHAQEQTNHPRSDWLNAYFPATPPPPNNDDPPPF